MEIALKLKGQSFAAFKAMLLFSRTCALSDSSFGNLIRYHHAVDPELLRVLQFLLDHYGETKPLQLDETAVLNVIAACDILRKMFACDAIDVVMATLKIDGVNKIATENLIDFANTLIKDLLENGMYKEAIEKLLVQLEETLQP